MLKDCFWYTISSSPLQTELSYFLLLKHNSLFRSFGFDFSEQPYRKKLCSFSICNHISEDKLVLIYFNFLTEIGSCKEHWLFLLFPPPSFHHYKNIAVHKATKENWNPSVGNCVHSNIFILWEISGLFFFFLAWHTVHFLHANHWIQIEELGNISANFNQV